ncbi:MAG TPA: SRPBCC domain-containing protein [Syntrophorhabdaceae bacterium]|nr:SRPBCC domain-containing protein [Syntrophorhabdaceae bacterium]
MKTYAIHHEVGIKASLKAVYQALTDTKKLAGWWTRDTRGSGSKVGDVLEFRFGDFLQKFEVVELMPGRLVRWKADKKETVEEWIGTEVAFHLNPDEKQVYVHFVHSGWRSDSGLLPHCSTKWAVFMLSLKDLLEKGKAHPYPKDVQINHD